MPEVNLNDDDREMIAVLNEKLNAEQEVKFLNEKLGMIEDALTEPGVSAPDRILNIHDIINTLAPLDTDI